MASRGSTVAARAQRMVRAVASIAAATTKVAARTTAPATTKATQKTAKKTATKATAVAPEKSAPQKAAPKKAAANATAPTKAAPKKTTKKTATSNAAPKKTATTRKAASAKKAAPATKAAPKKAAPAKKTATTKKAAPARRAAAASTAASSKAASLRVREDESPWTPDELAEVRAALEGHVQRLGGEISQAESGLADLLRDSGDGAGDDQADAGAKTFEREQEISLANNSREMLQQSERALARIDDGTYGICESCGNPIGKLRLQFFPRATLCVTCKQRQERR